MFLIRMKFSGPMKNPGFVTNVPLETLMSYKDAFDKRQDAASNVDAICLDKRPKPEHFVAYDDDHFQHLHKARFLRYPLCSREELWVQMPVERTHRYKDMDFEAEGAAGQISDKVLLALHNRKNIVTLKQFFPGNFNVSRAPMVERKLRNGTTMMDFNWAPINSLKGLEDSVLNYTLAMHGIWPLDRTGLCFMKLYNAYNWLPLGPDSMRIALICEHFDQTIETNCGRASNRRPPMTYAEMESSLKKMLDLKLLPSTPVNHAQPTAGSSGGKGGAAGKSDGRDDNKTDKKTDIPRGPNGVFICYDYNNKGKKCRRDSTRYGCRDATKEYHHICLWKDFNTNEYCFGSHSKQNHAEKTKDRKDDRRRR